MDGPHRRFTPHSGTFHLHELHYIFHPENQWMTPGACIEPIANPSHVTVLPAVTTRLSAPGQATPGIATVALQALSGATIAARASAAGTSFLPWTPEITAIIEGFGEVDERFKSHAWKACVG